MGSTVALCVSHSHTAVGWPLYGLNSLVSQMRLHEKSAAKIKPHLKGELEGSGWGLGASSSSWRRGNDHGDIILKCKKAFKMWRREGKKKKKRRQEQDKKKCLLPQKLRVNAQ